MEELIGEWIDSNLNITKRDYHSNVESFRVYKEKAIVKGVRAFNDYRNSIQHGYQLIINKLESELK